MSSKKQSGTKLSPYEKQLRDCTFFLDRNLGRKWAAQALRLAGARVEVHDDHFAQDVPDEEWLAACGERDWIVLTLDYRIRYRVSELDAIKRSKTKAFLIARAGQMNREELSGLLVRSLPRFVAPAAPPAASHLLKPGLVKSSCMQALRACNSGYPEILTVPAAKKSLRALHPVLLPMLCLSVWLCGLSSRDF